MSMHAAAQIGPYRIIRPLGVGGMGEVLLGCLSRPGGFEKYVAVKRVLPHLARDPAFIELFEREARLAAALNHRHIVQIFDFGRDEDGAWLAMEFVRGVDLKAVLDHPDARLPPRLAVEIAVACAQALDYAHRAADPMGRPLHMVHGDVTPHNVLLSFGGDVKLADFGLARPLRDRVDDGAIRGKVAYLSPEQACGRDAEPASDQYSLAVVLYEMLAARRAFWDEDGADAVLERVRAGRPCCSLAEAAPTLPECVRAVVERALRLDPQARFPTLAALASALQTAVEAAGWSSGGPTLGAWLTTHFPESFGHSTALATEPTATAAAPIAGPTAPPSAATPSVPEAPAQVPAAPAEVPPSPGADPTSAPDGELPASLAATPPPVAETPDQAVVLSPAPPVAAPTPVYASETGAPETGPDLPNPSLPSPSRPGPVAGPLAAALLLLFLGGGVWWLMARDLPQPAMSPLATDAGALLNTAHRADSQDAAPTAPGADAAPSAAPDATPPAPPAPSDAAPSSAPSRDAGTPPRLANGRAPTGRTVSSRLAVPQRPPRPASTREVARPTATTDAGERLAPTVGPSLEVAAGTPDAALPPPVAQLDPPAEAPPPAPRGPRLRILDGRTPDAPWRKVDTAGLLLRLPAGDGPAVQLRVSPRGGGFYANITSTPFGELYVDGRPLGELPRGDVPLRPGTRQIEVRGPDGQRSFAQLELIR